MSHTAIYGSILAAILCCHASLAAVPPEQVRAPSKTTQDHRFECGQVNDPDLAIEGCKYLLAEDPEDGAAYLSIALAYERIGDAYEALNAFISAINVGKKRTDANASDGDGWRLIALASQGAARVAKDEPDMRKDFEESAANAAKRAAELGLRVPKMD